MRKPFVFLVLCLGILLSAHALYAAWPPVLHTTITGGVEITSTPTLPAFTFATNTPVAARFATNTPAPRLTATPSPTPTSIQPIPREPTFNAAAPTWTPPAPDPASQVQDHYYLRRPTSTTAVNWIDRTYPYGGTSGGRLQVHHGVEFVNPRGTPLYATAPGTVIHAGDDLSTQFGPITNYYGNLVVIQHDFTAPDGQPVFTLYGHMDRVGVTSGQRVDQGSEIGTTGATGVALGPHLHFEVRVGNPFDFGATRNPELWVRPYPGYGLLAGLVTDAAGNRLYEVTLNIEGVDNGLQRYAFSYADDSVNGDPVIGENFTLGDLPAGYYTVTVGEGGRVRFQQTVYIFANRTNFLNVRLN